MTIPGLENKNNFPRLFQAAGTLKKKEKKIWKGTMKIKRARGT